MNILINILECVLAFIYGFGTFFLLILLFVSFIAITGLDENGYPDKVKLSIGR